jgi:hypothetical protein
VGASIIFGNMEINPVSEANRDDTLAATLNNARERASLHQPGQLARVATAIGHTDNEVVRRLEELVDRIEIRVTRGLAIGSYLLEEMVAGRVPAVRSLFETGRQDHTEKPEEIAAAVAFRLERERKAFGAQVLDLQEEDRPKYGFAYFGETPTEPIPYGPVCFILNLNSADLRARITFTPVDSSTDGLKEEEVGTMDHPLNAFARSSDAMRASGLLPLEGLLPPNSGLRNNAEEGVPEAQIWGALPVTAENVEVIIVEVRSRDLTNLVELRAVARQLGIPLEMRVVEGEY